MDRLDPILREQALTELMARQPSAHSTVLKRQRAEEELREACSILRATYRLNRARLSQQLGGRVILSEEMVTLIIQAIIASEERGEHDASAT